MRTRVACGVIVSDGANFGVGRAVVEARPRHLTSQLLDRDLVRLLRERSLDVDRQVARTRQLGRLGRGDRAGGQRCRDEGRGGDQLGDADVVSCGAAAVTGQRCDPGRGVVGAASGVELTDPGRLECGQPRGVEHLAGPGQLGDRGLEVVVAQACEHVGIDPCRLADLDP
jgi:hypothetical protein